MNKEMRIVIKQYEPPPCTRCSKVQNCPKACAKYNDWSDRPNEREMNWDRTEAAVRVRETILKSLSQQVHGKVGIIEFDKCAEAVLNALLGLGEK